MENRKRTEYQHFCRAEVGLVVFAIFAPFIKTCWETEKPQGQQVECQVHISSVREQQCL